MGYELALNFIELGMVMRERRQAVRYPDEYMPTPRTILNVNGVLRWMESEIPETRNHSIRVADLSESLAVLAGSHMTRKVKLGARVHDLGKLRIDPELLDPNRVLSEREKEEIRKHGELGWYLLSARGLGDLREYSEKHHEWWNGTGPLGLKGEEIPREIRMVTIADAYDAMTTEHMGRKKMRSRIALKEIEKYAGSQFDPILAEMFIEMIGLS